MVHDITSPSTIESNLLQYSRKPGRDSRVAVFGKGLYDVRGPLDVVCAQKQSRAFCGRRSLLVWPGFENVCQRNRELVCRVY